MSTTAEIRASRAYNEGKPGFYVVEIETHIAVAGPYPTEFAALRALPRSQISHNFAVYEVLT
jgi:hypothetical protein